MSRPIIMTESIKEEFMNALNEFSGKRMKDGVFTFSKSIVDDKKAIVTFSERAWVQQMILVNDQDKEVAWHGVCHRVSENEFYVEELLVYPQSVSAAQVEMDEEEYSKWIIDNIEDERFERIRFQAHSHVNMATMPSGTDLDHQQKILDQLGNNQYYIFMITNKRGEMWTRIYDLEYNRLYNKEEIDVYIDYENGGVLEWLDESKKMVKASAPKAKPVQQTVISSVFAPATSEVKQSNVQESKTKKDKKGSDSGKKTVDVTQKPKGKIKSTWYQGGLSSLYDDLDDIDDAYSSIYRQYY